MLDYYTNRQSGFWGSQLSQGRHNLHSRRKAKDGSVLESWKEGETKGKGQGATCWEGLRGWRETHSFSVHCFSHLQFKHLISFPQKLGKSQFLTAYLEIVNNNLTFSGKILHLWKMFSILNSIFERYGKIWKIITPDIGILQALYSWDFPFFSFSVFLLSAGLWVCFKTSKPFPTYL